MKQKLKFIIISLLSVVFLVSAVMICSEIIMSQKEKDAFIALAEIVEMPKIIKDPLTDGNADPPKQNGEPKQEKNLTALFEQNSDFAGWLFIPDTDINYPVMHTVNEPEKYLHKDFYGDYSKSGVPFIDYRCNLTDSNIIIYGHNMKNGTMFGSLKEYKSNTYKKSHEIIYFQTSAEVHEFRVTDVLTTDIYSEKYNDLSSDGTRKLMLSTCYGDSQTQRLIIVAEEVKAD